MTAPGGATAACKPGMSTEPAVMIRTFKDQITVPDLDQPSPGTLDSRRTARFSESKDAKNSVSGASSVRTNIQATLKMLSAAHCVHRYRISLPTLLFPTH